MRQIDAAFPADRQALQRGDTFAVRANAARENLGELMRHTCQAALRALLAVAPDLQLPIQAQLQTPAVFGPASDPHAFRLSLAERAQRLQTRVEATQTCAAWVQTMLAQRPNLSAADRASVTVWLARLEKIWADELTFTAAAAETTPGPAPATLAPRAVRVRVDPANPSPTTTSPRPAAAQAATLAPELGLPTSDTAAPVADPAPAPGSAPVAPPPLTITVAAEKGAYRLGSATDPDATYRVMGWAPRRPNSATTPRC